MSIIRQLIEVLLTNSGLSNRDVASRLGVAHNTVRRYRRLVIREGLTLERLREMTDDEVDRLFNKVPKRLTARREVDCAHWVEELKKPGMTKMQAYIEYLQADPETAYSRTHFNFILERYCRKMRISMRKLRAPGDVTEVDFAGTGVDWTSPDTGEVHMAEVLVTTTGVSELFFCYALPNQKSPSFLEGCTKSVEYTGGAARTTVPDNLKAAVTRAAGRDSEAEINRSFLDWGRHYDTVILPARPYYAKGKAVDEGAMRIFYRKVLAPLRNHKFFSVAEINEAMAPLIEQVNDTPYRDRPGTRRSVFEALDRPLLRPVPDHPYEFSEWLGKAKVDPSYCVRVHGHFYSVPYQLISEYVEPRVTASVVELYHGGKRVAVHPRSYVAGGFTVCEGHMPPNHLAYAQLTPDRLINWAHLVGSSTETVMRDLCGDGKSPQSAAMRGARLKRLERKYGRHRLEAACAKALQILSPTISSIKSILQHRLDEEDVREAGAQLQLPFHANVRGSGYYSPREV